MAQHILHQCAFKSTGYPAFSDELYERISNQKINASVLIENDIGNKVIVHIGSVKLLTWKTMQQIIHGNKSHWEKMIDIFNLFSCFCHYDSIHLTQLKKDQANNNLIMMYIYDEDLFLCTIENKYYINSDEFINDISLQELMHIVKKLKNRWILSFQHQSLFRSIVSREETYMKNISYGSEQFFNSFNGSIRR